MKLSDIFSGSLTPAKWRELGKYLADSQLVTGPGLRTRRIGNKTIISGKQSRTSGAAENSAPCLFGEIIHWTDGAETKTGIRGGVITCGDWTWYFDRLPISTSTTGRMIVYFEISVEVNMDDARAILLPGVKTGTKPTAVNTSSAEDFPRATAPVTGSGMGKVIVPIAVLQVASGAVNKTYSYFYGCGNITITHCSGTLNYRRE